MIKFVDNYIPISNVTHITWFGLVIILLDMSRSGPKQLAPFKSQLPTAEIAPKLIWVLECFSYLGT